MKTKLYNIIIFLLFVNYIESNAQSANTSLSNLISPTKVNVNLLPDKNGNRNLGSPAKQWRNIYFTGNQYIGTYRVIQIDTVISNIFIGMFAGFQNTTGSSNIALGNSPLNSNVSGFDNIAIGSLAPASNNESFNIAVGFKSLNTTTASQYNTAIGYGAGGLYNQGYNNVFVGAGSGTDADAYYNVVAIGKGTTCTAPSQARIGNEFTTSIGGYANWSNISDGRVKKNIKQNVPGLAFINKLQPITYNLDLDAADKIIQRPQQKNKEGEIIQFTQDETISKKIKEQIVYTGFVAQDVEKVAKSLNYDFSGVDAAKNDKDLYGLRYAEFVVPLVKAVQELDSIQNLKFKKQNEEIVALKQQNESLQNQVNELKAMIVSSQSTVNGQLSPASLQQNIPNPFNHTTTINYKLPQTYSSAKIIVTDKSGKTLKEDNISAKGKGSLSIDASTLTSGAYQYSLYVDGKLIDKKQMVLAK